MAIIGRVSQYASFIVSNEFNEVGVTTVGIDSTGTYSAKGLSENIIDIVGEGLVLNLDAGNRFSYPGYGTTWTDLSDNGNNGTLYNTPTYISSNGGSLSFDGSNEYVSTQFTYANNSDFTMCCWMKTSTPQLSGLIGIRASANASPAWHQAQIYITADINTGIVGSNICFSNFGPVGGMSVDRSILVDGANITDGNWRYIVAISNATVSKVYIDGVLRGTSIVTSSPSRGSTPFIVGAAGNLPLSTLLPNYNYNGEIINATFYNRELSAEEIKQNYDALSTRYNLFTTQQISLNNFSPYDLIYDEFASVLYGPGKGTYIKQYSDGNLVVYNELNEVALTPTIVFTPSTYLINEGGTINFSIVTTNIEDNIPIYYEIITPSPTAITTQSATSVRTGNSISFNATTVNVSSGTILTYDIVGDVSSSDFTDNTLTGITTVTSGVINTITKTITSIITKTFTLNLRSGGDIIASSSIVTIKSGLYDFTSATFTPGGAVAQNGPTLTQAKSGLTGTGVDLWKNNIQYFNISTGIQLWTVPATGTYLIEAFGAQGGSGGGYIGGNGVKMSGSFALTEGEIIRILVGQQGQTGAHTQSATTVSSGGGGTFVVRTPYNTNGSILVIAGGGGGSSSYSASNGRGGLTTNNGNSGQGGVAGGTSGNGGGGGDGTGTGPGGAGFLGNGAVDPLSGNVSGENSKSFINGGAGGRNARSWGGVEIYGGFGGGGGGGGLAAGGGGGYSGGGGGTWNTQQAGGGGGSYNSGTNQSNQVDIGTGDGKVTITRL